MLGGVRVFPSSPVFPTVSLGLTDGRSLQVHRSTPQIFFKTNRPQVSHVETWGPLTHSNRTRKKEQIIGTRDKPQCLDIQRYLSHLQCPVCTKSSIRDLSPAVVNLGVVDRSRVLSTMNQLMKSGRTYFFSCKTAVWWTALLSQHGFQLRGVQL